MTHFDPGKNKVLFGSTDKLADWIVEWFAFWLID